MMSVPVIPVFWLDNPSPPTSNRSNGTSPMASLYDPRNPILTEVINTNFPTRLKYHSASKRHLWYSSHSNFLASSISLINAFASSPSSLFRIPRDRFSSVMIASFSAWESSQKLSPLKRESGGVNWMVKDILEPSIGNNGLLMELLEIVCLILKFLKFPLLTRNWLLNWSRLMRSMFSVVDETKKSSGNFKAVPRPTKTRSIPNFPAPNDELSNDDDAAPTESEFGFFPPNHGSVNEKFMDLKKRLLDWIRKDSRWPPPVGKGLHDDRSLIFWMEKLLKDTPRVPMRPWNPP